ncbi:MAG TPA: cytochrome D1 domain-containing protein [Puia sp.]|nr:cytochrome D1 domain-containing protein [Puia sp.]
MNKLKVLLLSTVVLFSLNTSAQTPYQNDRVYTGNQVSNTVSVVDPSQNKLLGEIKLGVPFPNVLTPLYKGQTLVHGLRYSPQKKLLAAVSIGSNAVTFISTENNKVIKTVYVGRSPHEPTFTPDSKQIWVTVRGEGYVSVIDVNKMEEIKRIPVADGPGMVAFSPDGKFAYVCSSFTPELDVVSTSDYKIIKRIPVASSFSPNIFTSPDGEWVALTLKDIGAVVVVNTKTLEIVKQMNTGGITNHVSFSNLGKIQRMFVTVGAENKVRVFDVNKNFVQTDTINVGALPHGLWPSADGKLMYIGLEYGDEMQAIDLVTLKVISTIKIGQSPQALVYADNAVSDYKESLENLSPLNDSAATQIINLNSVNGNAAHGKLAVRPIGVTDLIEQIYTNLAPGKTYTLTFSKSENAPFTNDYEVNHFVADIHGKFSGQSTGLIKSARDSTAKDYKHLILIDSDTKKTVLLDDL